MLLEARCCIHLQSSSWMSGSSHAKVLLLALCGREQVQMLSILPGFKSSSDYYRFQRCLHTLLDELGPQRVFFQYHAARVVYCPLRSRGSPPILRQAPPTSVPSISYTSATLGVLEDIHILDTPDRQHSREPGLLYSEHLPA